MDEKGKTTEELHRELALLQQRIRMLEESEHRLKAVEKALLESESEKRAMLDASPDRIRLVDRDMNILWANKTATENLGVAPEDIVGMKCYELFTGRDKPCEGCPTKTVIQTGFKEHAILRKKQVTGFEGETFWDCYCVPLRNKGGEVFRLIQITRNITEKVRAEREAERRHSELKAISGILSRLTKENDLQGICLVLREIMQDFYPGSELYLFFLNPQRNGLFFPAGRHFRGKNLCSERGRRSLRKRRLEQDLLRFLTGERPFVVSSEREGRSCPAVILDLAEGFSTWIAVPIELENVCYGLVLVGSNQRDAHLERDLIFVETLIREISGVIRYQILKEAREAAYREQLTGPESFEGIVGRSPAMQAIYRMIQAVADSPSTILITGESGTGKELVARAIHRAGRYRDTPFVVAHCSSFVPSLVHSEIFGHERGAFTGAVSRKRGRIERAQGGILFLDEVADLPLETQVLLLRFLQDKSFERIGGERPVEADVRVIAATNKDIHKEMRSGRVREDFYYRLNVIQIKLPFLKERVMDIPLLANHFLRNYCLIEGKDIKGFDQEVIRVFMDYPWPGNVRELQNVTAKCVVLASGDSIGVDLLPREMKGIGGEGRDLSLEKNEMDLIRDIMRDCRWNKHKAARALRISRSTLYSKLKKYGIGPG